MLRLNVGLSKKVGLPQFGSKGASLNLEAEVETQLLQEPLRLKDYLRRLFGMVRESLEEELALDGTPGPNRSRLVLPSPETQTSGTRSEEETAVGDPAGPKEEGGIQKPVPSPFVKNRDTTTHPGNSFPGKPTGRLATPAQCGAIQALVRRQRQDLEALLEEHAAKATVEELTLAEASQLITFLRLRETSPVGQEV